MDFFNTGEVVLVRLRQFAIVRMSFYCILFLFLNDRGQALRIHIYVYVTPPTHTHTVQYIQMFLPAKPPLKEGCTREMIHAAGVSHRAIKLTLAISGFVKSARLLVVEPRPVWETLHRRYFLSSYPVLFWVYLTLFTWCSPRPCLSEGDVWLHAFTHECCIWTFESIL